MFSFGMWISKLFRGESDLPSCTVVSKVSMRVQHTHKALTGATYIIVLDYTSRDLAVILSPQYEWLR